MSIDVLRCMLGLWLFPERRTAVASDVHHGSSEKNGITLNQFESTREQETMKIRIITMLKNENDLTLPWIKYHGSLVDYENLIILDNGSTDERTLLALKWGAERGAAVDYQYSTKAQFVERGRFTSR
jgi:hypothetical protein